MPVAYLRITSGDWHAVHAPAFSPDWQGATSARCLDMPEMAAQNDLTHAIVFVLFLGLRYLHAYFKQCECVLIGAMAGAQADAVAAGQTSERPAPVCQQLKAALFGLFDASLAQRVASCRQLLTLFESSEASSDASDEQIYLEKELCAFFVLELSKALLIQVLSPELRLVALAALQQLPRWDAEVLNRAVRIPPFQREDDHNAARRPMEPWYGALFFVLDDEDQCIRAAALKVLANALCCKSGDGKVPEVAGLFQRLAQIASLCLHDHAELVRNEAAAALVEVMTTRNVVLTSGAASLKDGPALETLLEAFPRAPLAVMQVLKKSRLADVDTVQAALRWMVSVEHLQESEVQAVAWHLAVELQRMEEQPPPKRRKGSLKLDPNLVPGTRFLTASILHGEDPVAPAGMAMGLALARGAKHMDRLETVLRSLAARCDVSILRGPDAFPLPRSCSGKKRVLVNQDLACSCIFKVPRQHIQCILISRRADMLHMREYLHLLEEYWQETVDVVLEEADPDGNTCRPSHIDLITKLSRLSEALEALRAEAEDSAGNSFSEWLGWAELFKSLCEASLWSDEDDEGLDARNAAVRFHQAVSWLMHGFKRPVMPRALLAFRLWSLQFLRVPVDLSQDEKSQMMSSLFEDGEARPLSSLVSDCEAHHSKLSLAKGERWLHPRSSRVEQGHVMVDVDSSIDFGLRLKPWVPLSQAIDPSGAIEVPPSFGSRSRRVFYPLSCETPRPFHLQLYLDVDAVGEGTFASGSTCIKDQELHRLVNMIPVGQLLELHLDWT
eukprot:s1952_g7.t1